MKYYLARRVSDQEVSHLVCRSGPIGILGIVKFVRYLEMTVEEITKVEFDTYVAFGFEVTY